MTDIIARAMAAQNQNQIGILSNYATQPSLAKLVQDMANGTAVTIDCRGDSTYYGYDGVALNQVANPAPVVFQTILREYYGNNNITVINNGVSGDGTNNQITNNLWTPSMQSSTGQIVYINYGMNDAQGSGINSAINEETYVENLRSMILTARKYGKVVVLETPNPALATSVSNGSAGWKAEDVKQFAQAMRQVARELHVPLVDSFAMLERYFTSGGNILNSIPDGVHPSQTVYSIKGRNMASILIDPDAPHIIGEMFIPLAGPSGKGINDSLQSTPGSRMGAFRAATGRLMVPVWVDTPGYDIYIATAIWNGGASAHLIVDSNTVGTISMYDGNLGNPFAVDQEIMVLENATPGFHLIELIDDINPPSQIGAYYLASRKTRTKWTLSGADSGTTAPTITFKSLVLSNADITSSGGHGHVLVDVATSRVLKNLDIELTATFAGDDGFVLFAHPMGNGSGITPQGGLYITLDATTGYLTVAEGGGGTTVSFVGRTAVGSTDLRNASHTYRVQVTTAGAVTLYVDGTQVGTFTQTRPHVGGFLGFYKNSTGTIRVQSVYLN